jgi:hypothetical protein
MITLTFISCTFLSMSLSAFVLSYHPFLLLIDIYFVRVFHFFDILDIEHDDYQRLVLLYIS